MQVQSRLAGNLIVIGLLSGIISQSQMSAAQSQQRLPPPPPSTPFPPSSPLPTVNPVPIVVPPRSPNVVPVPTQQMPRINSVQPTGNQYRVYIDSSDPFVLQQARMIQPDAFLQNFEGRRVIQAGLFTDEIKARQQLSRFVAQGMEARMTTRLPQPNLDASETRSGYYAIVPGNSSEVQEYRERAVRLGVTSSLLKLRDRPRGLHLAVSPFPNKREAEQVVQYLRDRGSLDARLFYDR